MSRTKLDEMIEQAKINPMSIFSSGIEYVEAVRNGEIEIVDASNAFAYLMEFSATLFANIARKNEFLNRIQYPEQAMTTEELYRHMSNVDYLNIFSSPSQTTLLLSYDREELMAKAVDTGTAGVRKIVIPRHTKVYAGDVPFMFLYPIEIRVMPHSGLQVVFDNSKPTPIKHLETNSVVTYNANYNSERRNFIQLEVPALQLDMKSYTAQLSAAKIFNKTYEFTDKFYFCRCYHRNADGSWTEIKTTHTDQVYDPYTPTAVLKLLDNGRLNVSIPQVYFNSGLLNRELRVDIYSTRGALELAIQGYSADQFRVEYMDYDNDDNGRYTAPVSRLVSSYFLATLPATGGSNALSFEKLKERVINNALGNIDLPITTVQIQAQLDRLTDAGFSCVTDIDVVTRRLYAASRELPAPDIKEISTGIGANVVPLNKTINEILAHADVVDNGLRITVLPSTLYRDEGGFLSIVDAAERQAMMQLPSDLFIDKLMNNNFFYTPFHYVYDITNNVFNVRPYYFGSPKIARRFFVMDNGTLPVGISINTHNFTRTENGWKLQVMTTSTDALKDLDDDVVQAQLAYIPPGEITRVYLNGTLIGRDVETKEWIFEFEFGSNWDVDEKDRIYLTGFEGEGVAPHPYPAEMTTVFDIFFGVDASAVDEGTETAIDEKMGKFKFTWDVIGMYHEQVTLKLGDSLDGLWARARSMVGEEQYLRYQEDVPRLYTSNIPAINPDTGAIMLERDSDGNYSIIYEHRVGDIVYNPDGSVDYLHRAGDIIYQNGAPIVASPRSVLRSVEMVLFDGVYYFVNNQTDLSYRDSVPDQIVEWVNVTLKPVRDKLLENTDLWFHPKNTVGLIKVIVDEGVETEIQAGQHLVVKYYVTRSVYQNEALKEEMKRTTRKRITEAFRELTVTRNGLQDILKDAMGDDILGVKVSGLGGRDYDVISMVDESSRLVIAKRPMALPNGLYGVEDSIEINFYEHAV